MIRIAICDDSAAFSQQTKFMIDHWDESAAHDITVELFEDGDALLSAHTKKHFDIVFLDIIMPLISGMEVARELREKDKSVRIVFLTSSKEFAVESYAVKASNYLLKPLDPNSLFACLDELIGEIRSVTKCVVIKGIDAIHRIALADIEYIEAQLKHVAFFLKDGRMKESLEPFHACENMLVLDDGFFKCHRSYIVNIHHIDNYSRSEIAMRSGRRIPISRSCQKSFESSYFHVVFGKAGDNT